MTKPIPSTLLEELTSYGVDDWVDEALVSGNIARRLTEEPEERRIVAIGIITVALTSKLVEAGYIDTDGNFQVWQMSAADAAMKIANDWLALPKPDCTPGEVVWLQNTDLGDELAKAGRLD